MNCLKIIVAIFLCLASQSSQFLLENCEILDLSHPFNEDTIYWPGAGKFQFTTVFKGLTKKGYWYESNNLSTPEHGGTHMDAPIHFSKDSFTADEVPLTQLVGEACVVNITEKCYRDPDYQLSLQDIQEWENQYGMGSTKNIVILNLYTVGNVFGTTKKNIWVQLEPTLVYCIFQAFTQIPHDGLRKIVEYELSGLLKNDAINFHIGLDTASIDFGQSTLFETHQILFSENIPGFENLMNLIHLPPRGATVVFLPMKIQGGSGGPLRKFIHKIT